MRYIDQKVINACRAQGSLKHRSFYICLHMLSVKFCIDDQYQVEDSQQPCHEENKSCLCSFLWKKRLKQNTEH